MWEGRPIGSIFQFDFIGEREGAHWRGRLKHAGVVEKDVDVRLVPDGHTGQREAALRGVVHRPKELS